MTRLWDLQGSFGGPQKKNQNKIRLFLRTFTICHKCLNVSKTTNNPHSVIHVRIRQHVTLQDETDVGQNGTSITTALTCTDLLCNTFLSAHFIYSTVNINSLSCILIPELVLTVNYILLNSVFKRLIPPTPLTLSVCGVGVDKKISDYSHTPLS